MKHIFFSILVLISLISKAQEATLLKANYSICMPTSGKDYLKATSFRGFGVGFAKVFETGFTVGLEGNWNNFYEFVDKDTYYFTGGAITTSLYKYRQQIPVVLSLNYIFLRGSRINPYTGIGLGGTYIEDKLLFNANEFSEKNFGFLFQPKIGLAVSVNSDKSLHFFAEGALNYSSNKSKTFEYHYSSSLNISIGSYFLLR
jgi:outer membrane protein W